MNSVDVEKINEEIKLLMQKLEYLDKLERLIKNGATGYELAYECEAYHKELLKWHQFAYDEFDKIKGEEFDAIEYDEIENIYGEILSMSQDPFIKIGSNKVSEHNKDKYIKEELSRQKKDAMSRIGYLEFKKQKPEPEEIREQIDYKKDLDDFIDFLDDKFKEWEKTKSGKKE